MQFVACFPPNEAFSFGERRYMIRSGHKSRRVVHGAVLPVSSGKHHTSLQLDAQTTRFTAIVRNLVDAQEGCSLLIVTS